MIVVSADGKPVLEMTDRNAAFLIARLAVTLGDNFA